MANRPVRAATSLGREFGSLVLVEPDGDGMLRLFTAMAEDPAGFCDNADTLLEMWRDGGLRVAAVTETLAMANGRVNARRFLQPGGPYWLLPAFVAAEAPVAGLPIDFIWVAPEWRRHGIGSAMVKLSRHAPPRPSHILRSAVPFWASPAVQYTR